MLVLGAATLVRIVAMIGYRPALWFNDSYEYVAIALRPDPYVIRPVGYSFFLLALRPFHSFEIVVAAQHVIGLSVGIAVYALLRRHSFSWRFASLAASPVMFDGFQIQLEHLVLSETLYTAFIVAAVVCLLWSRQPRLLATGVAGVCSAGAALGRSVCRWPWRWVCGSCCDDLAGGPA